MRCKTDPQPSRKLFLVARFSAKPAPLFRLGLLGRRRGDGRVFFLRSRLLLLCLCALWFCSLWLWFGFFPFRLFFLCRLFLNDLRHINPLDERHRGGVALTLAKLYDARESDSALMAFIE